MYVQKEAFLKEVVKPSSVHCKRRSSASFDKMTRSSTARERAHSVSSVFCDRQGD